MKYKDYYDNFMKGKDSHLSSQQDYDEDSNTHSSSYIWIVIAIMVFVALLMK